MMNDQGRSLAVKKVSQGTEGRYVVHEAFQNACRGWGVRAYHARTSVHNLRLAGVPPSVATNLAGHGTEPVYRHYALGMDRELRVAVELLDALAAV